MNQNHIYSREELDRRLCNLIEDRYKKNYKTALCYTIGEPEAADYICPACGMTTTQTNYIVWAIEEIRKIVRQLKFHSYDAEIDEKEFCVHCGENAKEYKEVDFERITTAELVSIVNEQKSVRPELFFKIKINEESEYRISRSTMVDNIIDCLDVTPI